LSVIIDITCKFQAVLNRGSALAEQHGFAYWCVERRVGDMDLPEERLRTRTPMKSQRTGIERP
jgi:hypothetical protein